MSELQHDTAMAATRAILGQLAGDIAYERRLSVMYLLYYSITSALEKYEELAELETVRQCRPRLEPSRN